MEPARHARPSRGGAGGVTARAAFKSADLRRVAKIAREEHVAVCVELPDGTRLHFGSAAKAPAANSLDEMFG